MNGYPLRVLHLAAGVLGLLALSAGLTAAASDKDNAKTEREAAAALTKAQTTNPALTKVLTAAAGYAVFAKVSKGGFIVGGAHGKGVLYVGGQVVGYTELSQATIGLQVGGQSYTEIIAFETPAALEAFKQADYTFNAQATAVALKSGEGVNAKYTDGVAVFTTDEGGLMFEASIGGQKFEYHAK